MAQKTPAERFDAALLREGIGIRTAAKRTGISPPTLRAIRRGEIPKLMRVREAMRREFGIALDAWDRA